MCIRDRLEEAGLFRGTAEELINNNEKFDTIVLSNVINVQESIQGRDKLLNETQKLVNKNGRVIINLASEPRKPASPKSMAELQGLLEEKFGSVERVGPNLFEASEVKALPKEAKPTTTPKVDYTISPAVDMINTPPTIEGTGKIQKGKKRILVENVLS